MPDFAEFLDSNPNTLDDTEEFIYRLHAHGINVRFELSIFLQNYHVKLINKYRQLGYLRAKSKNEEVKNKILVSSLFFVTFCLIFSSHKVEAVLRVLKNQLRFMFRQEAIAAGNSVEAYHSMALCFSICCKF